MRALVLYGTLTMNTETVATHLYSELESSGKFEQVELMNMMDVTKASDVEGYDYYVIGSSTWSDGGYPPDAEEFMMIIEQTPPLVEGMNASFFGLGETIYEEFCDAAKRIRKYYIEELKVIEQGEMLTIDGYPDDEILDNAKLWLNGIINKF